MSKFIRTILIGIAPIALLGLSAEVNAQADDVDCNKCVDSEDVAFQAVTTSKIGQKAVTTGKLGTRSVTTGKLGTRSVTTGKLAAQAVTTGKIRDGAVTIEKVAPELSNSIGMFCPPGESVVGMDASGNIVCESLKRFFTEDCVVANGLSWCFNDDACGEACNDVCTAKGLTPVADQDAWFEAQNSIEKCQVIANALGLATVDFGDYELACLEDSQSAQHTVGGGLVEPLFCSTDANCPNLHLTDMDQLGIACGTASRRSVCPCE